MTGDLRTSRGLDRLVNFLITFFVIGSFWMGHHRVFEYARNYNTRLVRINFIWLCSIVALPFASSALSHSQPDAAVYGLYIGTMLVTSTSMALIEGCLVLNPALAEKRAKTDLSVGRALITTALLVLLAEIPLGHLTRLGTHRPDANLKRSGVSEMRENTFGYYFTMQAKPGHGPELRALMASANRTATAVESWLICTQGDDPDSLIGFEFYKDDKSAAQHDQNIDVAQIQAHVRELLAEPPTRITIRPTATSLTLLQG